LSKRVEIFVRLLDEDVDVWCPVRADHLGGDIYRIIEQKYDRHTEKWQFEPGDQVVCGFVESSEGPIFAAVRIDTA